ncbi:MAG: hypothetical protein EHM35_03810 [Planctomycetaceae bacterium]|nr:MAG: hypothetical protein EHM35_03810 [Planctomycetaceae bacterium]
MPIPQEFFVLLVNGEPFMGNQERAFLVGEAVKWTENTIAGDGKPPRYEIQRYVPDGPAVLVAPMPSEKKS